MRPKGIDGGPAKDPARQTGEDKGRIKRAQRTDATMIEKDLARGSEPRTDGATKRG